MELCFCSQREEGQKLPGVPPQRWEMGGLGPPHEGHQGEMQGDPEEQMLWGC
jgi:hypothetical protein